MPFAVGIGVERRDEARRSPTSDLWYRRTFDATRAQGRRDDVLLHFGAVDWDSDRLGQRHASRHAHAAATIRSRSTSPTPLKPGAQRTGRCPSGIPTDAGLPAARASRCSSRAASCTRPSPASGRRSGWKRCPPAYIQSLKIVPDIDRETLVSVTVQAQPELQAFELSAVDGGTRLSPGRQVEAGKPIELKIDDAQLWSPDRPHLYDLTVDLDRQTATTIDAVDELLRHAEDRTSPRTTEGINRLMLNNEVLFQYGPLDQGWWPDGLYTPATDEAMQYDIEMTKKLGMNMARKHVKYEPARWYYWCDKLGLLVWQDMPAGDSPAQRRESRPISRAS